jgi:hypothetical protein
MGHGSLIGHLRLSEAVVFAQRHGPRAGGGQLAVERQQLRVELDGQCEIAGVRTR